jgi:DNA mismatch repair ATPase MutL
VSRAEAGCGRPSGDRQFVYVNGRPIDLPKARADSGALPVCLCVCGSVCVSFAVCVSLWLRGVVYSGHGADACHGRGGTNATDQLTKAANEVYREHQPHQTPFLLLQLQLHPAAFDVNVTPDKRTVFLHRERDLVLALRVR